MFPWHRAQPLWEGAHALHAGDQLDPHLAGMWLALSVVAALIAYFVGRLSMQLVTARAVAARNDRLASLTTLAAGAAHELGSPLGTIDVAAREIERASAAEVCEDARLIRAEVERCRQILDRMSGATSHGVSALAAQSLEEILSQVRSDLGARGERLRTVLPDSVRSLRAEAEPLRQALGTLVRNGLDASAAVVELHVKPGATQIRFQVLDRGQGIAAGALAHVGEPFFSTKDPGMGTGLGLYVVRLIAERLGGQLTLHSAEGAGTEAVLALPNRSLAGSS